MLSVFYSDSVELPLPEKHAFPRRKYRLLRQRVERLADRLPITLAPGRDATRDELLRVHSADYIERVFAGRLTDKEQRAIGFPWSAGMVGRSLRSVGSTLSATEAAFAATTPRCGGWGAHLAGGTHHAFADRGQGYCVFNDVAVAIRAAQADGRAGRCLILDCDVHQGNGTAALFSGDASVFTLSVHGARNFPLQKEQGDLDVALPDGCTDDRYLTELTPAIDAAWAAGPFDAVFYISGADPFEQDRYGRMKLTRAGLRERDRRVLTRCRESRLPTVVVMGGGYTRDESVIADIHAATIEEAATAAEAIAAEKVDQ
ncbi:MAG: histone deacetylase [Planctomycetota bacterium]